MDNQIPQAVEGMTMGGQPVQDTLFSLEEMTVRSSQSIDSVRNEIKTARQMVKDAYAGSDLYIEQKNRVVGEKKQLQDIKKEIDNRPEVASILQQVKDLLKDLKDKQLTVSDCALEYARMAGKNNIEKNGITYDIVKSAKLVKRK